MSNYKVLGDMRPFQENMEHLALRPSTAIKAFGAAWAGECAGSALTLIATLTARITELEQRCEKADRRSEVAMRQSADSYTQLCVAISERDTARAEAEALRADAEKLKHENHELEIETDALLGCLVISKQKVLKSADYLEDCLKDWTRVAQDRIAAKRAAIDASRATHDHSAGEPHE